MNNTDSQWTVERLSSWATYYTFGGFVTSGRWKWPGQGKLEEIWKKTWLLRFTISWNREGWHSLRQVLYSQPVNSFLYSRCNLAGLLYCILYSPCNRAGLYSWSWRCKWQLALACDCDCDSDSPNHSVVASATAEKYFLSLPCSFFLLAFLCSFFYIKRRGRTFIDTLEYGDDHKPVLRGIRREGKVYYSLEEGDKVYSLEFGGGRGDKIIISLGFLSSPLRAGECGTRL